MEHFVDVIRREGEWFTRAARQDLDRAVPTCPEWTVRDLVRHLAQSHRQWTGHVRHRRQQFVWDPGTPPEGDLALLAWYADGLDDLLDVFSSAEPNDPVWTFIDGGSVSFWFRRMAHETTVHRVDAELAVGTPGMPVDEKFAVDGVDEMLGLLVPLSRRAPVSGDDRTVAVRTGARAWLVTALADGAVTVQRAEGKGDATVSATPPAVYLWLWGRVPEGAVGIEGDPELAGSLRQWAARF